MCRNVLSRSKGRKTTVAPKHSALRFSRFLLSRSILRAHPDSEAT
jgi:hypothetical protein